MFEFIIWLKFTGCILVTNSHLGNLYPISQLAIGGMLGNVLFFLCSGYCLSCKNTVFIEWYSKRLKRIYPSLIIANLIVGNYAICENVLDVFRVFIYPSVYWFIGAILFFYILMYFIGIYCNSIRKLNILQCVVLIIYLTVYVICVDKSKWSVEGEGYFKCIFYFGVNLLGFYLKRKGIKKYNVRILICLSGLMLFLHLTSRLACEISPEFLMVQCLVQLFALGFGVSVFFLGYSCEKQLKVISPRVRKIVTLIGASTLEVYLLTKNITYFEKIKIFPLNIILAVACIMFSGIVLHYSIRFVRDRGRKG